MKKKIGGRLFCGVGLLLAFVLWTVLVKTVDVKEIGQGGSCVGFATLNEWFHRITGVHMGLYELTDLFSIVPLGLVGSFALLGMLQWIRRGRLGAVDWTLFVLGGFYTAVLCLFLFFEVMVINYRPILIDGELEASYPSSTTLLVLSVMPTLVFQTRRRLKSVGAKKTIALLTMLFSVAMVVGRLTSGVHWLTDIVGSVLLSGGLFCLYRAAVLLWGREAR